MWTSSLLIAGAYMVATTSARMLHDYYYKTAMYDSATCESLIETSFYAGVPSNVSSSDLTPFGECVNQTGRSTMYDCSDDGEIMFYRYTVDNCSDASWEFFEITSAAVCDRTLNATRSCVAHAPAWNGTRHWTAEATFYTDSDCKTADVNTTATMVSMSNVLAMYGQSAICEYQSDKDVNQAIECINGMPQRVYYRPSDKTCSRGVIGATMASYTSTCSPTGLGGYMVVGCSELPHDDHHGAISNAFYVISHFEDDACEDLMMTRAYAGMQPDVGVTPFGICQETVQAGTSVMYGCNGNGSVVTTTYSDAACGSVESVETMVSSCQNRTMHRCTSEAPDWSGMTEWSGVLKRWTDDACSVASDSPDETLGMSEAMALFGVDETCPYAPDLELRMMLRCIDGLVQRVLYNEPDCSSDVVGAWISPAPVCFQSPTDEQEYMTMTCVEPTSQDDDGFSASAGVFGGVLAVVCFSSIAAAATTVLTAALF